MPDDLPTQNVDQFFEDMLVRFFEGKKLKFACKRSAIFGSAPVAAGSSLDRTGGALAETIDYRPSARSGIVRHLSYSCGNASQGSGHRSKRLQMQLWVSQKQTKEEPCAMLVSAKILTPQFFKHFLQFAIGPSPPYVNCVTAKPRYENL